MFICLISIIGIPLALILIFAPAFASILLAIYAASVLQIEAVSKGKRVFLMLLLVPVISVGLGLATGHKAFVPHISMTDGGGGVPGPSELGWWI